MDIIDGNGAYIPFKTLNFDTAYVNVTVNSNIYFYVLAEDGLTSIVYKLLPATTSNNAFILSDVYSVVQKDLLVQFVPRGTSVQTFFTYVIASEGATMKLVDKMGLVRADGSVQDDDKVVVTSPNGLVKKVYFLSMLSERYVPTTTYLAYVLSNIYTVDQIAYNIVGPTAKTLLTDFYSHITPSMGASAVVVDKNGVNRTSGDLNDGDKLKVTSADGKIVVMYDLKLDLTSADNTGEGKIQFYPNPTTGKVNIQGLEQGTRVQVFNQIGVLISNLNAERSLETITLENQPAGMYLIVLTKNAQMLGQYKVIRK
jgi:formylmethanofuran dehydrogenase subunit D